MCTAKVCASSCVAKFLYCALSTSVIFDTHNNIQTKGGIGDNRGGRMGGKESVREDRGGR